MSRAKGRQTGALEGKVAVITGGNSGIGLATARRFVKEGAYVFITARRQSELDAAVLLIAKNVTAVQGDVSDLNDLDRLYEVVRKVKGRVDIVFANAGVVDPVSLAESTPETFDASSSTLERARGQPYLRCRRRSRCSPTKRQSSFPGRPHGRWGYRVSARIRQRKPLWSLSSEPGRPSLQAAAFEPT